MARVRHESQSASVLRPLSELRQVGQIREVHGESAQFDDARERVAELIASVGLETFIEEAATRLAVISKLPYSEFLKTPEWKQSAPLTGVRSATHLTNSRSTIGTTPACRSNRWLT